MTLIGTKELYYYIYLLILESYELTRGNIEYSKLEATADDWQHFIYIIDK